VLGLVCVMADIVHIWVGRYLKDLVLRHVCSISPLRLCRLKGRFR
jgi:hypothetical protein